MRLNNYLNEDISLENLIENIKKDCKTYLKETKNLKEGKFYRGIKNPNKFYGKIKVRQDRKPKDMSLDGHNYLDKLFLKYHGWKARSQGVFCKGISYVHSYGIPCIIFPIGNYKYLWSKRIGDLYNFVEEEKEAFIKDAGNKFYYKFSCIWDDDILDYELETYKDYLYYKNIDKFNIDNTLDSSYLTDSAEEQLANFIKGYINKDLLTYFTVYNSKEIMINCKEYYYIELNTFDSVKEVLNETK